MAADQEDFPAREVVPLPRSALWEVVKMLSKRELRRLQDRVRGTRLAWLLETLRAMPTFSQQELRNRFQAAFPGRDPRLLGVYKRQLWDLIEETLPTREAPEIADEVRLWQRIWLSVLLHQRGQVHIAEVLWYQALYRAIELSWYEVALWLLFLLEGMRRDFRKLPSYAYQAKYVAKITRVLSERYKFLSKKLLLNKIMNSTEVKRRVKFPKKFASTEYDWGNLMQDVAMLLSAMRDDEKIELHFDILVNIAHKIFKSNPLFPYHIYNLYRYMFFGNIIVVLLQSRMTSEYERFYNLFLEKFDIIEKRLFNNHLRSMIFNIYFSWLHRCIIVGSWREAYEFILSNMQYVTEFIFTGDHFVVLRGELACRVYFIFVLSDKGYGSVIQKMYEWVSLRCRNDLPYLWWNFLDWYRAYREKNCKSMRYSYRKLRRIYKMLFSDLFYWKPVFPLLWRLSFRWGLKVPDRVIRRLLRRWEAHPNERRLWDLQIHIFPMRLFVESVRQGLPLHMLRPDPTPPLSLTAEQRKKVEEILYIFSLEFDSKATEPKVEPK